MAGIAASHDAHERRKALLVVRHAVENASNEPITDDGIVAILSGAPGSGSHLRAVFGDVPLPALARAGRAAGVGLGTILSAYAEARRTRSARNPELDAAISGERADTGGVLR